MAASSSAVVVAGTATVKSTVHVGPTLSRVSPATVTVAPAMLLASAACRLSRAAAMKIATGDSGDSRRTRSQVSGPYTVTSNSALRSVWGRQTTR